MKRILFGFLLFSLLSVDISAAQVDIKPGLRVGLNASTLRAEEDGDDLERSYDFLIGGQLVIDLVGPIDLQGEAVYTRKGTAFSEAAAQEIANASEAFINADYIQLNALARFDVTPGLISPYLIAGPYAAFEVSETLEASEGGNSASIDGEFLKGTDFGANIGLGLQTATGFGSVQVDLRYELGLVNLSDVSGGEVKNGSLVLGAGLTF